MQVRLIFQDNEKSIRKQVKFEDEWIGDFHVVSSEDFKLLITENKNHTIDITGESEFVLEKSCDRCLKTVQLKVPFQISLNVHEDSWTDEEGIPVEFIEDDELNVDYLIEDSVFPMLPMKVLCKEDCKGICVKCGNDLNLGPCGCDQEKVPTKFADAIMKALNQD